MGDICWSGCLLHKAIRAADVGGRSGVVYVEQCVILWLSRYLVVRLRRRLRWCAWKVMEAGYCVVVDARLCSVYCHCIGRDGQLMLEEGQGVCSWIRVS